MGTNDPSNVLANNNRVLPVSAANIATLNSDAINKTTGNSKSCSKSESRKINSDTCAENNVQGNEEMCQSNNHQQRRRHHLQSHQHQSPAMQHPQSNGKQSMNLANAGKKIRRALSMPRNPFRWSRKFKTNCPNSNNNKPASTIMSGRNSIGSLVVGGVGESDVGGGDGKRDGNGGEGNAKRSGNNGYNTFPTSVNLVSSKEKSKTGRSINGSESEGGGRRTSNSELDNNKNQQYQHRIFRRSSFRKFLNRIAQHVSSVGSIGENKHASTSSSLADRVPPIGGYQWPADQTPGVMGLKNHGNTCFMNAVLQCLSHTDILAEYFVLDQYKVDLKKRNKNNSRKFGTKGELTEQLANVLKALWTCKNESDHSTSFKAVVDRYGSQFRSSTQHDAQEFLFWLLDKVHEDLNTATKRRYKNVKNNYGRSDEVIAAETLANYIRCNNSFVQAVFQAQFRSSLTCPRCKKQSNTFDPFHCISVQLPQLTQQAVFVTVLYVKRHPRQVKLGLTVPVGSPIVALKEQLQKDTGIPRNRMILAEINTTGFSRVFYDNQPVSTLESVTSVYCIEIPEVNSDVSSDLLLLIANVRKTKEGTVERFGLPFCVQVPRDCSYTELQKKLLKEMSPILKPEIFAYSIPLTSMFQIRLQDPSADPDTYLEHVEHPLFTEMIDLALSVLSNDAGPAHIKLLLEWVEPGDYFMDMSDYVVEHESVTRLKANKSTNTALTLEQCLEHYTKAETLSAEDAWRCPHCQQYLPVVKTLGLWSLPDILVIHFKRFRQHHDKGPDAAKLTTMVNFPLNAFDMSPHLARGTGSNSIDSLNSDSSTAQGFSHRSPWKKTREYRNRTDKENRDTRYDLYAVCYHQGDTLETGHYTAACKNPYDHQWYKFDDQRVSRVESDCIDEEIINNEAYMLFYQRRTNDNGECSGSSSNSGDHWVSKIAMPTATSVVPTTPANLKIDEKSEKSLTPTIPSDSETATEEPNARPVPLPESSSAVTTTVVIEKTDENEVVDIEGIEFVDEIPSIDDTERILAHEETNGVLTNNNENISDVLKTPPKHSPASKTNSNVPIDIIPSTSVDEPSIKGPKKEMAPASPVKVPVQKVNSSFPIDIKTSLPKHTQSPTSVRSSSSSSHFNHFNGTRTTNFKEALSSSLNSNSSSIMVSLSHDYNRGINGSGSNACLNGNGHCVNLRHSFSNSSNYILKDCTDTLSSMLRNTANTCSKDTLIFIDQQSHNLIDDDDSFLSSPSLWISPVTPHKLITVSPKN